MRSAMAARMAELRTADDAHGGFTVVVLGDRSLADRILPDGLSLVRFEDAVASVTVPQETPPVAAPPGAVNPAAVLAQISEGEVR